MCAGRYPDIFGDDVATEQHYAGRADHQKTLQKIPVISGQVHGPEDKGGAEPGGEQRSLAAQAELGVTKPEDGQKRQYGDHLLAKELRGRFYIKEDARRIGGLCQHGADRVVTHLEQLLQHQGNGDRDQNVDEGDRQHQEDIPPRRRSKQCSPCLPRHHGEHGQGDEREQDGGYKAARRGFIKCNVRRQHGETQHHPQQDQHPAAARQGIWGLAIEGEVPGTVALEAIAITVIQYRPCC
ncbi:hypothetical protein D3C85_769800 [compost metagenome]